MCMNLRLLQPDEKPGSREDSIPLKPCGLRLRGLMPPRLMPV